MRKNKKGDAMIMVICIMAVFLALSLAAIFSASSLMSGAVKSRSREQCRLSAVTFSEMLKEEMIFKNDYEDHKKGQTDGLRNYIRAAWDGGWRPKADEESTRKKFTLDAGAMPIDENAGEIKTEVYCSKREGAAAVGSDPGNVRFTVAVTCEKKGQKQVIRTEYAVRLVPYQPDGTSPDITGWTPETYLTWAEQAAGNYLAWAWTEDGDMQ